MNASYAKALSLSLPENLSDIADDKTMKALDDPQVLLSEYALEDLRKTFQEKGDRDAELFQETVEAIRYSLGTGLRNIFWVGSIMMIVSFLIICTVPRKFADIEE